MWKPLSVKKVPMLIILHIGVLFINIELFLELIGLFNDQVNSGQAAIHLLLTGGLGAVGIGIMTRVSLGHTGREIHADGWTSLAYISIIIGCLIRVIVPIFFDDYFDESIHTASGFWTLGFLVFFIRFFKILTSPRYSKTV